MLVVLLVLSCVMGQLAEDTFVSYTHPEVQEALSIRRFGLQQGFHRNLVTEVIIGRVAFGERYMLKCQMLLLESIPSGMYLDMDQIAADQSEGQLKVLSQMPFDTEKPEYLSKDQLVYVFHPLLSTDTGLGSTLSIPVHLRYHRPSDVSDQVVVNLTTPQLLVRCEENEFHSWLGKGIKAPCDAANTSRCWWTKVHIKETGEALHFHVPVGKQDSANVVMAATLLITTGGVVFLTIYFIRHSSTEGAGTDTEFKETGTNEKTSIKSKLRRDTPTPDTTKGDSSVRQRKVKK